MNELLSSLDGMLLLETAEEILDEAFTDDFSFVDSMLLNQDDIDLENEEANPYV